MNIQAILKRKALGVSTNQLARFSEIKVKQSNITNTENGNQKTSSYLDELDKLIERHRLLINALQNEILICQLAGSKLKLPYFQSQADFTAITGCELLSTYELWQSALTYFVTYDIDYLLANATTSLKSLDFASKWLSQEQLKGVSC